MTQPHSVRDAGSTARVLRRDAVTSRMRGLWRDATGSCARAPPRPYPTLKEAKYPPQVPAKTLPLTTAGESVTGPIRAAQTVAPVRPEKA